MIISTCESKVVYNCLKKKSLFEIAIDDNNMINLPENKEELEIILTFLKDGYKPQLLDSEDFEDAKTFLEGGENSDESDELFSN